jgi:hypothetical protein
MNAKGFARWEKLEEEFLNSDLAETEFCQSRSLSLKWFKKQRRKAENYKWRIESKEPNTAKNQDKCQWFYRAVRDYFENSRDCRLERHVSWDF